VSSSGLPFVLRAANDDARAVAQLLHDFNREFDEPTPAVGELTERISRLLDGGDTVVLLVGDKPDGLAVLRFRAAIWSSGLECYLAELYVAPARRGQGFRRALVEAAIREARARGHALPLDGKEGVDGSSPSEGFVNGLQNGNFRASSLSI
jgi:GNAT superfamily N-acetyltransferase